MCGDVLNETEKLFNELNNEMNKYALVSPENLIIDIATTKSDFIAPQLKWVELPENSTAAVGMILAPDLSVIDPKIPNLSAAIRVQTRKVMNDCQNQIYSGFLSMALGKSYLYASNQIDQQNITQTSQCPNGGLLSCSLSNSWIKLKHTQEQAQIVLNNFVEYRDSLRLKCDQLISLINAASTIEQVLNINW